MTIVTNSIRWSHHQKLVSRHSWLLPLPQCNRTFPTFKKSAPPVCWQTQMSWKQLGWKRCLQTALTNLFFKHRFLGNRCLETIVLKIFWSPNFSSDLVTNLVFTQFGGQFITKYTANISVTIYKLFGIFGSVEFPPCSTPLENADTSLKLLGVAQLLPFCKAIHGKATQGCRLSSKPRRLSAWLTRPSGVAAARKPKFSGALKKAFEGRVSRSLSFLSLWKVLLWDTGHQLSPPERIRHRV